jgi:hypothetical protein
MELQKQVAELTEQLNTKQRMLDLANKALERAGSAARFGIHREIPEGALVFADTAESIEDSFDIENEPAYSQKQWNELTARAEQAEAKLKVFYMKTQELYEISNALSREDSNAS